MIELNRFLSDGDGPKLFSLVEMLFINGAHGDYRYTVSSAVFSDHFDETQARLL